MLDSKKRFNFHWGSGFVAEEAQVESPHHLPTLQLLKYTDGDAEGQVSIRFCQYGPNGRFRRSPLMMSPQDIEKMRESLVAAPELRSLLARLIED